MMSRPPVFPAEQKMRIVLSILAGEISAADAARQFKVSEQSIGAWKLVKILRRHIAKFPLKGGGPLFVAVRGGVVSDSVYTATWRNARFDALSARQYASPMAKRPYDLRHAAVSTWLNAGVPPTQIAEWAGHSVEVLLRVYAKCIDGQDHAARRRIADALGAQDDA
jgi:integrase